MKSYLGLDFSAGASDEIMKEIKKALKKAKIKLSKKAYVVWPYDEKGEPEMLVVIDQDKAYIVSEDSIYVLQKVADIPADSIVVIFYDEIFDMIFIENDAEYFKISLAGRPDIVGLGFIHEELGMRHFFVPFSDAREIKEGEEKEKIIELIKKELELPFELKPEDVKYIFIELSEAELEKIVQETPELVPGEEGGEEKEEEKEKEPKIEAEEGKGKTVEIGDEEELQEYFFDDDES